MVPASAEMKHGRPIALSSHAVVPKARVASNATPKMTDNTWRTVKVVEDSVRLIREAPSVRERA
jgi:hypothetical protein